MKKRKNRPQTKRPALSRRGSFMIIAFAAVIALGAITVASKQLFANKSSKTSKAQAVATQAAPKYVTVKVAGRDVQVDPQTGQLKPLTSDEAKQMADGLKTMLNKSTDDLVPVQNADGSVSMDLKGHFQNVAVARVNADGTVEQSCIDEPQQAAQFFGIDPQLLGVEPGKGAAIQPVVRITPRKVSQ